MFQQDLGSQVEEVRWFVEEQQVGFVKEQRGQLHARLPSAGQFRDRAVEVGSLQFKLTSDFAAFPVGLSAVSHQELLRGFSRQERIVLAQVAQLELRVAKDFSGVEFFFAQKNPQQSTFAGAVPTDDDAMASLGGGTYHLDAGELDLARGVIASHLASMRAGLCPPITVALEVLSWLRSRHPEALAATVLT